MGYLIFSSGQPPADVFQCACITCKGHCVGAMRLNVWIAGVATQQSVWMCHVFLESSTKIAVKYIAEAH